ncbi:MAG: gamma carbonic anhydrase family protein [Gammaproteobacteria bacterium]|nr:gamma carbonic anhydrase family protein [Gammaproteobacteria bacterium]
MKYSLEGKPVLIEGEVFIAPTATVIGKVLLKDKSSVWWGAVLRGDYELISVGERSNIQDNCIVHMDADFPVMIGNQVTVGHKAVLHGCTIGNNALIGINSVIMNGVEIGDDCLIGSNTLITEGKQIPPRSLVIGSPGKIVRELSDEEVADITDFSDRYVRNSKRYRETLKPLP